jgi:hypothetical protein
MSPKTVKSILIVIGLLVLLTIVDCDPYTSPGSLPMGLGSYNDIQYFSFEPESVLTVLDQGTGETFKPLPATVDNNLFSSGSFPWRQQDYLKIAGALNQVVAKDTLEDWKIFKLHFDRDCADNPTGFDYVNMTFFKTDGDQYSAREIDVYPLAKEADWGGDTHFPRPFLFGWKSIDLEKLKVTADDALQMAETNGGKEARLAEKNSCYILVMLSPNTDHENWGVYYYGDHSATLFAMTINPYSGEYQIISNK